MKQGQIIAAYKALYRLSEQVLPIKTAWAIAKTRAVLKPFWEFQLNEERRYFEMQNYRVSAGGDIVFSDSRVDAEFRQRMAELANMDQDVSIERFTLRMDDSIELSARDIEALAGIVDFEGAGDHAENQAK